MGLTDVVNGILHGPHGQTQPGAAKSSGMSPIAMAVLGLLAYQALKKISGSGLAVGGAQPAGSTRGPGTAPGSGTGAHVGGETR